MNRTTQPRSPEQVLPRIRARLAEGLPCRLVVTGSSMLPFLRHGQDAVYLIPADGPIRVGDILFYLRSANVPILHRVHKLLPDGTLIMCGDAQVGLEPIRREQVLAKVSHVEHGGKTIPCARISLRLSVRLWRLLRPLRPYLLAFMRKIPYIQ